jgi:glycosyltransferase involved in cell wall biosynthesis
VDRIREFLSFAGKGEDKVIAVFGLSPAQCDRAVRYVRAGAPGLPVWLFVTRDPLPETADLCRRVFVDADPLSLFITAQKELWPQWVALALATWTGERGGWPVKLAPFLVPPFRALLLNAQGDYFSGKPAALLRHAQRRARDAAHSGRNRLRDVHRGAWLWLAGLAAGPSIRVLRHVFARARRESGWPGVLPASSGAGIAEFRYHHRQWDWPALDEFIRTTPARWILFLADDAAAGDAQGLAALLEADPSAFAASRQRSFRAWRAGACIRAPFRQLQPQEASRTLAPVSDAILVDRARLAALGMPRTITPGAAWLLLFWKAAAAGLRAYSAGGPERLAEHADWPLEEAEFILRCLAGKDLRRLAPRDADLSRGSIAFRSPSAGPPLASPRLRPRVLVVSPYLPWPLSHGGAVRIYNLCRALSDRVEFLLIAFREKNDCSDYGRLHDVFRRVWIVDRDQKASRDPALPAQVREHASASMRALIRQVAGEERVDVLQVEYTHMAGFRDAAPGTPGILVEHDLTFTLFRQLAEAQNTQEAHSEYGRWLEFERRWLRGYDAVWTMSTADQAAAIDNGSSPQATWLVPNGVDTARFAPSALEESGEILYVGSFRHLPNVLGFRRLLDEIMPRVWERLPQARLRVVAGPEPLRYWSPPASLDKRVLMHGFVEDLRPLYARASVVAVPLVVSAGTNIKVMEAMACAKAVVSTPIGCAGLDLEDGRDAVIREDPAAFAEAIVDLLNAPDRRARVATAARATTLERFTWERIAQSALASYEALSGVTAR